jgi:hypothetical protein
MQVTVELNKFELDRLKRNLVNTHKCVGLTTQWLVWDNMRLAMQDAIKYTAPWAAGNKPGITKEQEATGHAAIVYDLVGKKGNKQSSRLGLFGKITGDMDVYMDGNWSENLPNHNLVKLKSGAVYLIDKNFYMPSASKSDMEAIHKKYRLKNGRVSRAGQNDLQIGRWKAKNKYFVRDGVLRSYVSSVKKRVGSLKASWIPALEYFAKKTNGAMRVSAWIANQKREGTFRDNVNQTGNGSAVATSFAHHSQGIRPDMITKIQEMRNKFMRNMGEKRMQQIADIFKAGNVQPKAITA